MQLDRHQKITELLDLKGKLRVSELSRYFGVTYETIRRDLDILEQRGQLTKTHGGAVRVYQVKSDEPYFYRENQMSKEKHEIAAEAVKLIMPGDKIMLDGSTTVLYLTKIIPDIPLTVVTNSIKVAMELSGKDKVRVISTGGILLPGSFSNVGPLAEKAIESYHVNKVFFSCNGIHYDSGLSETNELQALVKLKMIQNANQAILLIDHSKFRTKEFTQLCPLDMISTLITDQDADLSLLNDLEGYSIDVRYAPRNELYL
jgi:DeoR family L-fucose operon activator